jgi:hypothetical protein
MTHAIGILHPAHIIRGAWAEEPSQVLFLKLAKHLADGGKPPPEDPEHPPPGTLLFPSLTETFNWAAGLWEECPTCRATGHEPTDSYYNARAGLTVVTDGCSTCHGYGHVSQGFSCDIEAAGPHITIVGMCRLRDLVPIVVRFRKKGGDPYHETYHDLEETVRLLYDLLADPRLPKVFHNGQAYDVPVLEGYGFTVRGYYDGGGFDTMLGMRICYPEMPKDLEYVAKVFAGLPPWKYLSGLDPEGEDK